MSGDASRNFGILIAYIVPGFAALCGLSFVVPELDRWLFGAGVDGPTVGGVLYVTIASIGAGMTCGLLRWATLDRMNELTGLRRPEFDDRNLEQRLGAFSRLVEDHYRYYQFYGNTLIAMIAGYAAWRISLVGTGTGLGWLDASLWAIAIVFIAGSRDALSRYHRRTEVLLGTRKGRTMTNGSHPKTPKDSKPKPAGTDKKAEGKKPAR
ncbi:MAG: hypothetical protein ACTS3F_02420 [Phycisphaerales bacterium]